MIDFAVMGGGAAGIFAAISYAEFVPGSRVVVFEKSTKLLSKVKVSGGGRCNVTHACYDPKQLVAHYPRGGKELRGAFHRWQPRDMEAWFSERGVTLKREADGRMFPHTDDSQTIIDCFLNEAKKHQVDVRTGCGVAGIKKLPHEFVLTLSSGASVATRQLMMATGGGRGLELAESLGHSATPLVPSLFALNVKHPLLDGLAGISVQKACAYVSIKQLQKGPVLITHAGLSGPAILRLSAWGARDFAACDYRCELVVDWTGGLPREKVDAMLREQRNQTARKAVVNVSPLGLPARLWARMCAQAEVSESVIWAEAKREHLSSLVEQLCHSRFQVTGKSTHKEEFVTCGGVDLREVDMKRFESRLCPNLFFAGEVLNIDGITGGFNFQAAWTGARLAAMAATGR